ncbi:MAG TPA: dienelactone hydrolase family protein [Gaiellaceae bacterium]|nr:dienelactone hydrolase family protein [Gaiellaceae bacterium]
MTAPGAQVLGDREVTLLVDHAVLPGLLAVPPDALGVVAFAHGSGSSRFSPRNRLVAAFLNAGRVGTLLFDLLTPGEAAERGNVFDVELLAARLAGATRWLQGQPETRQLPVGYFGASTGTAAALWAAADLGDEVSAVVSRGGRPDLAEGRLASVRAPTLLIVGGADDVVLELNRRALESMTCAAELRVVAGAGHLFEEPGTLEEVAQLARDWLLRYLRPAS